MNRDSSPSLDSLIANPAELAALEPAQVGAVLTQIAGLQTALAGRLLANSNHETAAPAPDKMLTVEQAAEIIHETPDWIKRHAKRLPFVRRISRKKFLVSEAALNRWLASRRV